MWMRANIHALTVGKIYRPEMVEENERAYVFAPDNWEKPAHNKPTEIFFIWQE